MARVSPLNDVHVALGAKLVDFGGWNMPVSYPSGTVAEHMACRNSAAMFDVSHLGTVRLNGPEAFDVLQSAFTNDLTRIAPGETQYTHMLDDDGSVLDDLIIWWIGPEQFDVVANASNTKPVTDAIGGNDVTATRAVIAVQGPKAREIVAGIFQEAAAVAHNRVVESVWNGAPATVAGTGYTGEDGIEIAIEPSAAAEIWQQLQDAGVTPAGLGARDTLRLEVGLPLHGHELGPGITTLQAGLGWVLAWDKGPFRGRDALNAEKTNGLNRRLRGLLCEGRQPPREGNKIFTTDGGPVIGSTTSGNYSPVLNRGIALALIDPSVKIGDQVRIDVRGRSINAEVVKLPFVKKEQSLMNYVPHTDAEIQSMLEFIGVNSLDSLFDMVPAALRLAGELNIAPGVSEFDVLADFEQMANANRSDLICFAGAGSYDHEIPSAVKRLANRTEFVTAYTPYQPEVAQGVLQALFEYQTLISRLAGLEVSNASVYDGASACVEALNLAVAATGNQRVYMSQGVHPNWRHTMATMAQGTAHDIVDCTLADGLTDWSTATDNAGAIVVQYPNYLGNLEDLQAARAIADSTGARLVVVFDHLAGGVLKSPGAFGADVVVGEGQCFGTPMALGGPYLGLFSCNLKDVRRLPGRLVGETTDTEGTRSYVTTLRTREQDIRREKASSNICTNQTLIAVTCAIQLGWLGSNGIRDMALRCAQGTRYTREILATIDGVEMHSSAPVLREFAIRTPIEPETVVDRMIDEGFLAGVPLHDEYGDGLLIAVTEKRTREEIDAYAKALAKVVQ